MTTTKKIKITGDVDKQDLNKILKSEDPFYLCYKYILVQKKETEKTIMIFTRLYNYKYATDKYYTCYSLANFKNADEFLQALKL